MAKLIIITGAPGSGKTTLAKRIGGELGVVTFCRDEIKERMYDALPEYDQALSKTLGAATYPILYGIAKECLSKGISCVVESNFRRGLSEIELLEILKVAGADLIQIWCNVPAEVARGRSLKRWESAERHPGHQDHIWLSKNDITSFESEKYRLEMPGELVEIDMTDFEKIDYAGIIERIDILGQSS